MKSTSGEAASANNLRIAYLVSQYPAVTHTFILNEIRQLRQFGVELCVASISQPDRARQDMPEVEQLENSLTFYVKSRSRVKILTDHLQTLFSRPFGYFRGLFCALAMGQFHPVRTLSALFYFIEAVIVGQWMRRESLTHFHTHFSTTVGLICRKIFPQTMSMTIHGPSEFNDPVNFRLGDKIASSSFVCAISNYARSQLMKASPRRHWSKIEVAPLGIDTNLFTPHPFREVPEVFEVVCIGRLVSVKAQHVLIEAIHELKKRNRRVRLRLIGDGPDRADLERFVAASELTEQVIFEGWRNQQQILELYRHADVFALASFAEGVPVALMEAMAMQIPCVATRITGIPELIRDGIDGLLVAPSSVEELTDAIERLIEDTELRREIGKAGRKRVKEKYELARNVKRLAHIYAFRLENIDRKALSEFSAHGAAEVGIK
ncbi:MAG TPA: glycosyltransferase family 4 protein [Pyrinomonadaceae bacterium]|jgi:glycosyltransferase involved in cell wall biosynthesis